MPRELMEDKDYIAYPPRIGEGTRKILRLGEGRRDGKEPQIF